MQQGATVVWGERRCDPRCSYAAKYAIICRSGWEGGTRSGQETGRLAERVKEKGSSISGTDLWLL